MLLAIAVGCSVEPPPGPPEPEPPPVASRTPHPPVQIVLTPPVVEGSRFRWEAETAGLVTLLVEAALGELDGCLVTVAGRPRSPGVLAPVGLAAAPTWRTRLTLGPDPDELTVGLEICSDNAEGDVPCTSVTGTGTREDPQAAIPPLVALVSRIVDRAPAPGASAQWSLPISADPYAVLVAGRAAASWYGLLPAPHKEIEGDNRRDPLARAVFIDPSMPLSQWLVGRRSALAGRWDDARPSFTAARQGRPFHPVLVADEAEALVAEERPLPAAEAWDGLMQSVADDPRFRLPHALAVLRAGRVDTARELLDALAQDWPDDPGVSAARVAVADAAGEEADLDRLLANWQDNDPTAIEPVRRRIQLRVRGSRWREAWELLPELRHRGAHDLADGLALSLGSLVGEAEEAARAAERVGRPDVAARLRARAAIAARRPLGELPPIDDLDGFVAAGHAALDQGLPEEADAYAERASRQRPWDPDVLALVAATARARGDLDAAARAEARRRAVEPAVQPSMVTATENR